jgi:purine-nucleoside phosphorylase
MKRLGVSTVLLTNAAGGLCPDFNPGDLMAVTDHINMLGSSPLVGSHDEFWGPRFPDQSAVYDAELRQRLSRAADEVPVTLLQGVYLATTGPTYETPAEIRAFRALGADAVGMSTVPEAILANSCGLKVAAVSCITNLAAGISGHALSHEEVTEAAAGAMPGMKALIEKFFETT